MRANPQKKLFFVSALLKKSRGRYKSLPWILVGVCLFAFILRLIYVCQWFDTPYGNSPFLDAEAYDHWAQQIAAGHLFRHAAFYIAPMLPYILGLLYAIFGHSLWIASLLNTVLGVVTCALLARLAFLAFGPLAAITTGILAASYKPFLFYTPPIMKESLALFFMTLFVTFIYDGMKTNKRRSFLWGGISLGLCAIVRGNVIWFIPAIPLCLYLKHRWQKTPQPFKNSAVFIFGALIAILPITLHNAIASHDFVLLTYSDGFNFYIGHNAAATGTSYVFPPGVTSSPEREEFDVTQIAEHNLGHHLRPSEVSAFWRDRALNYIFANPGREFRLLFKKFGAFWSNNEPFDNYDMRFIANNFDTLLSWPLPGFGLLVALALFAGIGLRNERREDVLFFAGMTFHYMLSIFPFYITDRYRLPVVICFLPLSGAALPALQGYLRSKKRTWLAGTACFAIAVFGWTFWAGNASAGEDAAFNWSALSTMYEDQGDDIAAIQAFNKAVTIDPRRVGSDAWIKVSDAKAHLGDPAEAETMLEEAMKRYPADGSVTYNYGRIKLNAGDYPAAFAAFKKAVEQMPVFAPSYRGMAVVYDHYGQRDKAIDIVQQGLAIVPTDSSLQEVLGQLQQEDLNAK